MKMQSLDKSTVLQSALNNIEEPWDVISANECKEKSTPLFLESHSLG